MMATFGVEPKKGSGVSKNTDNATITPGGARKTEYKHKTVSDIKAKFDQQRNNKDDTASSTKKSSAPKMVQSNTKSSWGTTGPSEPTKAKENAELSSNEKEVFVQFRMKLKQTGIEKLIEADQPSFAVAKSFPNNGQTATVDNKFSKTPSRTEDVSRSEAASLLSQGITKIMTRHDYAKTELKQGQNKNSLTDNSDKKSNSAKLEKQMSPRSDSNDLISNTSYKPGVVKGWKPRPEVNGEFDCEQNEKLEKLTGNAVAKLRKDAKDELNLKGYRSVSPVNFNVNSSDDSSSSCNVSPRGYTPKKSAPKTKVDALKTDINENIRKFENSKSDSNLLGLNSKKAVGKANLTTTKTGPKLKVVEKLSKDKEKLGSDQNSGSFSSDSEKSKKSPMVKGEFTWIAKRSISVEESRHQADPQGHSKTMGEGHKPVSRSSSSGSSSSFKEKQVQNTEKFVSGRSVEKSQRNENLQVKAALRSSRKLGTLNFDKIKKGFESKTVYSRNESPSSDRKPIEIKTKHNVLERKQSFEGGEIFRQKSYEKKEVISPRDRGSVQETVKKLAERDAEAKAEPKIVRRTQSLPMESFGDDSSLDYEDVGDAYYQDIENNKIIDDESNEGDVSSEPDLYEEIPANTSVGRLDLSKDLKSRKACKKRKKLTADNQDSQEEQTGSDGDIDSDTDSSNSGIYEPVDRDDNSEQISDSDSVNQEPPELPPPRTQNNKKKKDKAGKSKGFKGKIKDLYKGKSMDYDGALKSITASGFAVSPQSAGLVDKLKRNKQKPKPGNSGESLNKEDNPVCDSEGVDTDFSGNSPRSMEGQDQSLAPPPPPLPPRRSSTSDVNKLNNGPEESDPPLPPRNRISGTVDLNIVVPVRPGGNKSKIATKDSYLHGQKINQASDIPYMDQTPSPKSPPSEPGSAPPLPQRPAPGKRPVAVSTSSTDSYVDVGDRKSLHSGDSYIEMDVPALDHDYSLADEIRGAGMAGRKELEKRPISSGYIKPHDLATVPEPRKLQIPFEDVIKYQNDDDMPYMDFTDDQVYGTMGSRYKSHFETESLYQFYNKEKITRASKKKAIYSSFDESDEEGYFEDEGDKESVYEDLSAYSSGRGSLDMDRRPEEDSKVKKISTLEMFGKKGTVLRALWAEMQEVKDSGVLKTMNPHERKLQESMFEIITSEATYLKSLNVLYNVFLMSDEFGSEMPTKCVLTKQERHVIFSNIGIIRDTSEKFLAALEERWKESVILSEKMCDIISDHASKNFDCYIHYCSNQVFQDRAVTDLRKKPEFAEALRRLESHPDCQGLPMISFLLLPMQRITRLPLLVDAICHRMDPIKDKARHKATVNAFNSLSKVVKRCNEGAKKMQQTEQMYHIAKQIDFPASKEIPQIPLISASRYLVKQGEVTKIVNEAASRIPFGKAKPGKQLLHIFLFNDMLLLTKKKGERYVVTDYGQRNTLHAEMIDSPDKNPRVLPLGVPGGCKYLFLLVMLENYEKKQVETVFSCNSLSDRARWVDAVTPVKVTDDQRIYEEWDCPQVQCIKKYTAQEPDELTLDESDVVNVFKKLEDGMYEGERLRDGERGWFPKDHTVEIVNSHVRARNLRMKYRLMQATGEYA